MNKKFKHSFIILLRNSCIKSFLIFIVFYTFLSLFRRISFFAILFVILFFTLPVFIYRNSCTIVVTSSEIKFYHFFKCYKTLPLHSGVYYSSIVPKKNLQTLLKPFGPYYFIQYINQQCATEIIRCLSFNGTTFTALMQEIHAQRYETPISVDSPNAGEELKARVMAKGITIPTANDAMSDDEPTPNSIEE